MCHVFQKEHIDKRDAASEPKVEPRAEGSAAESEPDSTAEKTEDAQANPEQNDTPEQPPQTTTEGEASTEVQGTYAPCGSFVTSYFMQVFVCYRFLCTYSAFKEETVNCPICFGFFISFHLCTTTVKGPMTTMYHSAPIKKILPCLEVNAILKVNFTQTSYILR